MRIQSQKKRNITRNTTLIVVFILLISLGIGFYYSKSTNKHSFDQTSTTDKSSSSVHQNSTKTTTSTNQQISTPETVEPSFSVGTINIKQEDGNVVSSAQITADSGGSCNFTYTTADSPPVIKNTPPVSNNGSFFCQSTIPEIEFTKIGTWKLTITYVVHEQMTQGTTDVKIR